MNLLLDDGFQDGINRPLPLPMRPSVFFKGNVVSHYPWVENLKVLVRPGYKLFILGE